MFNILKNLINLNSVVLAKVQRDRLYDEADALFRAGRHKEAFPLMKQASDLGSEHATVQMAMMFLRGQGTACDWVSAAECLELAIARGIPNVHINLGLVYGVGGYGLKRNPEKAEYYLVQAIAVDNDGEAEQMLAMLRKKQAPFGGKENPRPKIPWQ